MKNEARLKLFWSDMYVSAPADPSPPLDLELYSRASQKTHFGSSWQSTMSVDNSQLDLQLGLKLGDSEADRSSITSGIF